MRTYSVLLIFTVIVNINDLALVEGWAIVLPPPGICGVYGRETGLYFLPLLESASLSLRAARGQPAGWERAVSSGNLTVRKQHQLRGCESKQGGLW